jgi:hypothetical protein
MFQDLVGDGEEGDRSVEVKRRWDLDLMTYATQDEQAHWGSL